MNGIEDYSVERLRAYRRMGAGAALGGLALFVAGYAYAYWTDHMNPLAGYGLVVLTTVGIVIGAFFGMVSKRWVPMAIEDDGMLIPPSRTNKYVNIIKTALAYVFVAFFCVIGALLLVATVLNVLDPSPPGSVNHASGLLWLGVMGIAILAYGGVLSWYLKRPRRTPNKAL